MVTISWVTVIWSMVVSACVTLAAIYFLVWWTDRSSRAHLLFSLTAGSTAAVALCELCMMRAQTPQELDLAIRWLHLPLLIYFVSLTWFVLTYLDAGRRWLAWTVSALRVLFVLPVLIGQNPNLSDIPSLQHVQLLGEALTVYRGVPNPWALLGSLSTLLVAVFVADASVGAWRRGERRKAVIVGGSVELCVCTGLVTSVSIIWGNLYLPLALSIYNQALIAVMGYELSRDVLRASQLVRELEANEVTLHDLSGRLLSAQEDERRRIARELHDNLSQQVAALSIGLSQAIRELGTISEPVAQSMHGLRRRTSEISDEIRNLSHRLHSSKLALLGLVEALRGHCVELAAQGLEASFEHENVPRQLPHDMEICLFRIVQEGLNNVVKHSGVREAHVTLRRQGGRLVLTVADLGRGFDGDVAAVGDGLGLASMRERLRLLQGELTVTSRPGQGTTLVAKVAIPQIDDPPRIPPMSPAFK